MMLQRRLLFNGGYLRLDFFMPNCNLPVLELDSKGVTGAFLVSPFWGLKRMLFWTVYEKFSDGYEIWGLRKNASANNDINEAAKYLKSIHSVLNCGWSTWTVDFSNPIIFSGISLIQAGKICLSGIRRIGVDNSEESELLRKIDVLIETYFKSRYPCCPCPEVLSSNSKPETGIDK